MFLDSFLRSPDSHGPRPRTGYRVARSIPPRLLLEPLEERALPSFLAPLGFDVGAYPRSVAVGDFNRDGRPDLATANQGSANVSVLLSNGDGTFQAPRHFAAGSSPFSVAVGDFNADAIPDLAVANSGSANVSVLLGNGDGSFQAPRHFVAGNWPNSVAVGEFNGDGRPDLAVANSGSANVSVLLGNGDGTFQAARHFPAEILPWSVAAADFSGDGRQDLAVTSRDLDENGIVLVLLGNGDGTFQAPRTFAAGYQPVSVAVGDFNRDTRPDLVVANEIFLGGTVSVLLGNGDGTFQSARSFPARGTISVAVGDFNRDGSFDLVTTESVLLGNGDGTFQAARHFYTGGISSAVAAADVNGDDRPDLAVAHWQRFGTVSVLLGNGDGTFPVVPSFAAGTDAQSVAVADLNGDGRPDLAVTGRDCNSGCDDGTVGVLLGNGDGSFQAPRTFATGAGPRSVAVADFNRDGRPDLAVAGYGVQCDPKAGCIIPFDESVSVLLGNGDGSFQAWRTFDAGREPAGVAVADFNVDGRSDFVVQSVFGGRVLLGNGDGSFQAPRSFAEGGATAVGHFNADALPDLAVTNSGGGFVSVLLGNGDGSFQAARHFAAGNYPNSVAVGEFNGDGRPDLAVGNSGSDSANVLLGNGDGSFQPPRSIPGTGGPVAVADFNGDGFPDIAIGSGTLRVLLGNGDGTFQLTDVSYIASFPQSTVDLNGDGWPDLAGVGGIGVAILLNAADDAAFFYLDAPAQVIAGQPFDLTVYALSGDWQRLAHGYRGTVAFWSSDEAATLPEPHTFRPEDWGIASFPGGVTLRTPGTQYLAAYDVATFTVIGYAVVDVLGAAPGGGGGAPLGAADFALAQVGLDLATWTRFRKVVPTFGGTTMS